MYHTTSSLVAAVALYKGSVIVNGASIEFILLAALRRLGQDCRGKRGAAVPAPGDQDSVLSFATISLSNLGQII